MKKHVCDCRCRSCFFFLYCILYVSCLLQNFISEQEPFPLNIDFLPKEVRSNIFLRVGEGVQVVQSLRLAELKVLSARRRKGVLGSPTGLSGQHSPIHQSGSSANPLLAKAGFIWAHHTAHIRTSSASPPAAPPPPPQSGLPFPLAARNYNQLQNPWNSPFYVIYLHPSHTWTTWWLHRVGLLTKWIYYQLKPKQTGIMK